MKYFIVPAFLLTTFAVAVEVKPPTQWNYEPNGSAFGTNVFIVGGNKGLIIQNDQPVDGGASPQFVIHSPDGKRLSIGSIMPKAWTMPTWNKDDPAPIVIGSTGIVGIGTNAVAPWIGNTANEPKLIVNGRILAKQVVVTNTLPQPDYVFESNYPLLSLDSLRRFIERNKHLPGVPSAKEVEKAGVRNLEADNLRLLEKVEEQALYILQLDQRLRALDSAFRASQKLDSVHCGMRKKP
jgi:hypothetical protein